MEIKPEKSGTQIKKGIKVPKTKIKKITNEENKSEIVLSPLKKKPNMTTSKSKEKIDSNKSVERNEVC